MLVVARLLVGLLLHAALLALRKGLLDAVVLHRADALLLQVVVNLRVVHRLHGDGPPALLKLLVDEKVRCPVVIEENLLLVDGPRDVENLICTDL